MFLGTIITIESLINVTQQMALLAFNDHPEVRHQAMVKTLFSIVILFIGLLLACDGFNLRGWTIIGKALIQHLLLPITIKAVMLFAAIIIGLASVLKIGDAKNLVKEGQASWE